MTKHIAFLFLILAPWACAQTGGAFFGTFAQPPSPNFTIEANYGAIIDGESGQLLWGKSEHSTRMMASTTKTMTLLLAVEYCNSTLDSHQVTISATADAQIGSNASLIAGAVFTMRELLYALIMPSGNDAAYAIAEHIGGTAHLGGGSGAEASTFIARMNSRASELGMTHTSYANPHGGIDADSATHFSCAVDMARIGRVGLNLDPAVTVPTTFATVVARSRWQGTCVSCNGSNANVWYNGSLVNCIVAGGIGIKAGNTAGSGVHHIGAARRNGRTVISASLYGTVTGANQIPMMDFGFQTMGLHGYPSSSNCQEQSVMIGYVGAWTESASPNANFDQNYANFTSATDATASLTFRGTGIEWWSSKSSTRGITEVSIDGGVVSMVDAYSATQLPSAAVYQNLTLPWGSHTIQLRVTGTKNASSSSFVLSLDAFKVYQ